jgi:hypothetical protein
VFIAALFKIAKLWNKPTLLINNECIKKMWNGVSFSKKQWNNVVWRKKMDGTGDHHVELVRFRKTNIACNQFYVQSASKKNNMSWLKKVDCFLGVPLGQPRVMGVNMSKEHYICVCVCVCVHFMEIAQ